MFTRLIKCTSAWAAGTVIISLPMVFLFREFSFGSNVWQIPVTFFTITFPVLLLIEFIFRDKIRVSKAVQTLIVISLFILSEWEFAALPFRFSQMQINLDTVPLLAFLLFTIPAAVVVVQILSIKKNLVIVHKEI